MPPIPSAVDSTPIRRVSRHRTPIDPNETADMLAMFTIRARNMQYCGSVTISFVNESLPQRDDPLLHEGYTRVIVASKACAHGIDRRTSAWADFTRPPVELCRDR